MNKLLVLFFFFLLCIPLLADDHKKLVFKNKDNSTASITSVGTVITFSDDMMTVVNGDERLNISLDDLAKMYFSKGFSGSLGDVNLDGTIDITDALIAVDYILGRNPDKFNFYNADMDGSGGIFLNDVLTIVAIILGKE